tara:strand:+ start:4749 stop:6050 length:1302 start_codon:yes stop_codon:yes gene_type:complete
MSIESQHSLKTQSSLNSRSVMEEYSLTNDTDGALQIGGAPINKSCIINHMPCTEDEEPDDDKKSKIISKEESEWWSIEQFLEDYPRDYYTFSPEKYLLLPTEQCEYSPEKLQLEKVLSKLNSGTDDHKCVTDMIIDDKILDDKVELANIIFENSQITLEDWWTSIYDDTESLSVSLQLLPMIYIKILAGIATLNLNNFSHRHIKRSNIIINDDTNILLSDFGLIEDIRGLESYSDFKEDPNDDYLYWPTDLLVINTDITPAKYRDHDSIINSDEMMNPKFSAFEIAWNIIHNRFLKSSNTWAKDVDIILALWSSLTQFIAGLHITNNDDILLYDVKDSVIQNNIKKKWDVFMLGALLAEELNNLEDLKSFLTPELIVFKQKLKPLVIDMISLNPMKRISLEDTIREFIKIYGYLANNDSINLVIKDLKELLKR